MKHEAKESPLKEQKEHQAKKMSNKYETKKAYHLIVEHGKDEKHYPEWGGLDPVTSAATYRRHKVNPKTHKILTHSDWAKGNMKKLYDKA